MLHLAIRCHFINILWYSVTDMLSALEANCLNNFSLNSSSTFKNFCHESCSYFSMLASICARTFASNFGIGEGLGFSTTEASCLSAPADAITAGSASVAAAAAAAVRAPRPPAGPRLFPGGGFGSDTLVSCVCKTEPAARCVGSGGPAAAVLLEVVEALAPAPTFPRPAAPPSISRDARGFSEIVVSVLKKLAAAVRPTPTEGRSSSFGCCFSTVPCSSRYFRLGVHMKSAGFVSSSLPTETKFLKSSRPTFPSPLASM
mmetsp:Transcript_130566/g.325772  ORF Transcript_130566/g.325772 Transcript_130566/m.325772 type:complete len:259 (-) Transcript_130566:302-1078(-)